MADTQAQLQFPRVTIQFCTQCKWMLRAAYFAQELLSTFSTSLGEVSLQPSTGGTFIATIHTATASQILWDRKRDGGFPETKELKRRVRDVIEPGRDLGHVDRVKRHDTEEQGQEQEQEQEQEQKEQTRESERADKENCEDCK